VFTDPLLARDCKNIHCERDVFDCETEKITRRGNSWLKVPSHVMYDVEYKGCYMRVKSGVISK
jgi:hypothetical protein